MDTLKAAELRGMSEQDLVKELEKVCRSRFKLSLVKLGGDAPKHHLFKRLRRNISRIKTIIHEKKMNKSVEK